VGSARLTCGQHRRQPSFAQVSPKREHLTAHATRNRLAELIDFLDPKKVGSPARLRDRLALPESSDPKLLSNWEG
jgi:hypothetical protein